MKEVVMALIVLLIMACAVTMIGVAVWVEVLEGWVR